MVNKKLKRFEEKHALFLIFMLLAVLVLGSLFVAKPKLTGFAVGPEGQECDGNWTDSEWSSCVDGNQTKIWTSTDSTNCELSITEFQSCVDTAPVITITGDAEITIEVETSYTELGATATDDFDDDTTLVIVIVNPVDTNIVGTYTVTYNVNDSAENTAIEVTRIVNVVEDTAPVITLTGDNPQELTVGDTYIELGATATDDFDDDTTLVIVIDSSAVNMASVGVYTVNYNINDSAGNNATQVTRTVNIVAACVPEICGSNCGDISDGCGGILDCGECEGDDDSTSTTTNNDNKITTKAIESSCVSNWECGEWTECAGGTQTRECTDAHNCVIPTDIPAMSLPCTGSTKTPETIETPETCSDEMKNQDEKGIDCGGVCGNRCGLFTIMGNAVNVPINSSKQFIEDNKVVSFSILGVIALIILWIIIVKVFLKKKKIFFFLNDLNFFKKKKKLSPDNANP